MNDRLINRISNTLSHLIDVKGESVVVQVLRSLLEGAFQKERDTVRGVLQNSPNFEEVFVREIIPLEEHREQTLRAVRELLGLGLMHVREFVTDPKKVIAVIEAISYCDLSVSMKLLASFNHFGNAILFLGTKRHHERYLDATSNGRMLSIYALTELGHDYNIDAIETTATFDRTTREFVINSPTWTSQKYLPANSAKHGEFAVVFARLILNSVDRGIHAFVVRVRSAPTQNEPYGLLMDGIEIRDIGLKIAYNGVDNGSMLFKQVRIPMDNMLDRFSRIDENGDYQCDKVTPLNGMFVLSRMCSSVNALCQMKVGLSIALHYSFNRKQFGPPKSSSEIPIIYYPTTQIRLIPYLARAYALDFAHKAILESKKSTEIHDLYSSGLKVITTFDALESLEKARMVMGGQGSRMENRVVMLKEHVDCFTTIEEDNIVLCLKVAQLLLIQFHRALLNNSQFTGELLYINNVIDFGTSHVYAHLDFLSLTYQQFLLESREYLLLKELHSRIYSKNPHMDLYSPEFHQLFQQSHTLAVRLTRAHVDRLIQSFFLQKIIVSKLDPPTLSLLKDLCRLDSLTQIQNNIAFYFEHGIIPPNQPRELESQISGLCKKILPNSLSLTDAFSIPKKYHPLLKSIE